MTPARRALPLLLAFLLLLGCAQTPASDGRVIGIADGDTITVLTAARKPLKVRLADIDTPERRQPWGMRARQALSEMVFQKPVHLRIVDTDRYGRTVATVWIGDLNINAEMVRQGHAWVYRRYLRDSSLLDLEEQARQGRRGLWALPDAERTSPWIWRRQQR